MQNFAHIKLPLSGPAFISKVIYAPLTIFSTKYLNQLLSYFKFKVWDAIQAQRTFFLTKGRTVQPISSYPLHIAYTCKYCITPEIFMKQNANKIKEHLAFCCENPHSKNSLIICDTKNTHAAHAPSHSQTPFLENKIYSLPSYQLHHPRHPFKHFYLCMYKS